MKLNRAFLLAALIISPATVFGADTTSVNSLVQTILKSKTIKEANDNLKEAKTTIDNFAEYTGNKVSDDIKTAADNKIQEAKDNAADDITDVNSDDTRSPEEKAADLQDKQDAYDEAKANEQSMANKTLTSLTTAATGLGAMEMMQGLSEKNADANADQDMKSYIETFRCTYGQGKNVKAGPTEIELPGGNLPELMKLRSEYVALATDLKERKTALGMKPGIESEEILDKSQMGLYDDEFVGITGGAYESLYRAQMLNSEEDKKKIDEAKDKSAKRVKYGAIALGAGAAVGIVGNSLINGKLGEWLSGKDSTKKCTQIKKIYDNEQEAFSNLKKCLRKAEAKNVDKLTFNTFLVSVLNTSIDCKTDLSKAKTVEAQSLFIDVQDAQEIVDKLVDSFGRVGAGKLIGSTMSEQAPSPDTELDAAKEKIEDYYSDYKKRIESAIQKDKKNGCDTDDFEDSFGISISD